MDKAARYSAGRKVTWIGALGNILLTIIKLLAGWFGKSEALIADAIHSLSDLVSDVVVLMSLKLAAKPIDEERPYGYGKVETLGTAILGLCLITVGIKIFWDAVIIIDKGVNYIPTAVAVWGAALSIVVKEGMYHYTARVGKKINSPSIIANAWHHRSDAISSVASLVGISAAMMGWPLFDPIAAIVVTFLILKVGWKTTKDSVMDIIDTSVGKEIRDKIVGAALDTSGVISHHELKTRKMGSEILADIHIEVNPWINVSEAHRIADRVRDSICLKVPHVTDVLVHIDPEGELNGIIDSIPREKIIENISKEALGFDGIISCKDIMIHYVGQEIIVNMTIVLSPELTIKQGYSKVAGMKEKLLQMDSVIDAVISVDLKHEAQTN